MPDQVLPELKIIKNSKVLNVVLGYKLPIRI